jgi:cysteine desulfurase
VLRAMNLTDDVALAAIRLSLGRWTTHADVDRAAAALVTAASTHARPRPDLPAAEPVAAAAEPT